LGSQVPRFNITPSPRGFTVADAVDAVDFAAGYGLVADEWQETTCHSWMRRTKTGRWCSSTWGITVSRQNGKNGSLEIVELYGMVALGLKFLHTAHEVKTARKAFTRLKYFFGEKANDPSARFPELNALVREVRNTNGQEAIVLLDGGSCEFIARSKGSGRGFTVDVLVLDEAQDLQDHELEALLPTTSAAPSGDPVTIFMGTPPKDTGEIGEPFVRARDGAVDGTDKRISWVEFSAKGNVTAMKQDDLERFVKDRNNWAEANPALGRRINLTTIESELARFSASSFARERLNMWPEAGAAKSAIPKRAWAARAIETVPSEWPLAALGLDMNPERTSVTIAPAVFSEDGVHVEIAPDDFAAMSSDELVSWIFQRVKRRIPVVMDAYTPARSLEPALKKKGARVFILGPAELSQACGGISDAVMKDKTLTHYNQEQLNSSLEGAFKEPFGKAGAWKWNRKTFEVDLTPIMAATAAHFGAVKFGKRPRTAAAEKRKVVIL
jgi:hypothetical protein